MFRENIEKQSERMLQDEEQKPGADSKEFPGEKASRPTAQPEPQDYSPKDLSDEETQSSRTGTIDRSKGRSSLKDSAMLDPIVSPLSNENIPKVVELALRYEEQPTMKEMSVRKRPTMRRPRMRRKKQKLGLSEETVFDNVVSEDEKSGRTKSMRRAVLPHVKVVAKPKELGTDSYGYDNLGEVSKEEEEKKAAAMAEQIRKKPTPPKQRKEARKEKSMERIKVKERKEVETRSAERIRAKPRKHVLVSEKTTRPTEREKEVHEVTTQVEGVSKKESPEMLKLDETDITGVNEVEEEEALETAIMYSVGKEIPKHRVRVRRRARRIGSTKVTVGTTIVDILSIMCLLSLMNDYWVVPVKAVENGGLAYLLQHISIMVILVHPVLCFVLFISQYTQTGIANVFKLYGPIFEGFGYGYVVLIFVVQMEIVHQGSILLKHLIFTYSDSLSIGTCSELFVDDWSKCSSIFLDSHCIARNNNHSFYAQGFCWNLPISNASGEKTSESAYIRYLIEPEYGNGFDFGIFVRHLFQLSFIAILAFNGPTMLRSFLAILAFIFLVVSIADSALAFNSRSLQLLLQLSDFSHLQKIDQWISALRLAFSSSGLGEVTIFCMSSLRHPRSKFFLTATVVVIGKMLISSLGLFSLLNNIVMLDKFVPRSGRVFSFKNSDLIQSPAFMVDVFSMFDEFTLNLYDHGELIYVYHMATSFAAMFMVFSIARNNNADNFQERVPFVGIYTILCCFYAFIVSFEFFHMLMYRHRTMILSCSLHFYMAVTIFLLIFCYGVKKYHKDIRTVFPRTNSVVRLVREIVHAVVFMIAVIALLLLQGYELVLVGFEEHKKINQLYEEGNLWKVKQEYLLLALAVVPFILPLGLCIYRCVTVKKKHWLKLSNEHPTARLHNILKAKRERKRKLAKSKLSRRQGISTYSTGDITNLDDILIGERRDDQDIDLIEAEEHEQEEAIDAQQDETKRKNPPVMVSGNKAEQEGISGPGEKFGDNQGAQREENFKWN